MSRVYEGLEPLRALIAEAHKAGRLRRWHDLCRQHDSIVIQRMHEEARAGQPGNGCQVDIPEPATSEAGVR